jgi:DNA-binding MarR family transcriptional regulator
MSTAKLKKQILVELSEKPMTLNEIAEMMELKPKRTFRLLRSLFQKDQIKNIRDEDGTRRYAIAEEK